MPLKIRYATEEEIPQEQRPHYAQRDGAWVLDVEGAAPSEELARERQSREAAAARAAAAEAELTIARTEEAAVNAALLHGLKPNAAADLRNRARSELTLVGGKPAKKGEAGAQPTPISISEWVAQQARDASPFSPPNPLFAAFCSSPSIFFCAPTRRQAQDSGGRRRQMTSVLSLPKNPVLQRQHEYGSRRGQTEADPKSAGRLLE